MPFANSIMIEDDYLEPYNAWKATPGPEANAAMLKTMHPMIESAIRTHVGEPNPLIVSRARKMALDGLRSYDPKRGRLQPHMYSHLTGLKRANRQQTTILKVPERVSLDRYHLSNAEAELANELGREPTDDEMADRTGFSPRRMARVRSYVPGIAEGTTEQVLDGNQVGVQASGSTVNHWHEMVYDELDPYHKKVMELAIGRHGRPVLSNQDIAARLQRSPGAISQAKARIQKMLDEEHEFSPFGT